jgi:uncharacterized hydrophobic protein (TIGR00271 family)
VTGVQPTPKLLRVTSDAATPSTGAGGTSALDDDTRKAAEAERDAKIDVAKAEAAANTSEDSGSSSSSGSGSGAEDPSLGVLRKRRSAWWHRHLDSEERQRIMSELAIKKQQHWAFRFSTMLALSMIVAVMGLSADSAAVVIGAMLLAPLMQPVLAMAACISMALFRKSLRQLWIITLATVGSIALAYVLSVLFVRGELPREVTSRTAPDIRDLVVALGAGTAGAYATVRKDASSSLPGVAVAVALVPPLGAVGISLEAGRTTLAEGALLLYITNLAAIVFAGAVVFVVTGFVPRRRLAMTIRRSSLVAAMIGVIVIAIAIPLYRASTSAVEQSERELQAERIVSDWLSGIDTRAQAIDFEDDRNGILITVRSFELPIDDGPVIEALRREFGDDATVSVEWDVVLRAETTTTLAPTTTVVSDEERLYSDVEAVVDDWLDTDDGENGRRRESLRIDGDVIRLDASGVGDPPPLSDLNVRLDSELGRAFEVRLTWVARETVRDEIEPTPDEQIASRIEQLARTWAESNDVVIVATRFDGSRAIVEVAGADLPDATPLVTEIEALIEPDDSVVVLFTQQLDITTTTTTTTTTTVPPTTIPG